MTSRIESTPKYKSESSALVLLLRKIVHGTSHILEGMIDLSWDIDDFVSSVDGEGIGDLCKVQTTEEYELRGRAISELYFLYLSPLLQMLLPLKYEDDACQVKNQIRSNVHETNIVFFEEPIEPESTGLLLPIHNVMERLDFVITQMDIARMERSASRRLDVESIHRLPTVIYGNTDLMSPPYEYDTEDEGLKELEYDHDNYNSQVSSWMLVPRVDKGEMSGITEPDVPESICIHCSPQDDKEDINSSFIHCVICQEHFREGEVLRVLPCDHLFHCACVCSTKLLDETLSGCPICKKVKALKNELASTSHQVKDYESVNLNLQDEVSYYADGSVPSWAFQRLGGLLSR